MHDKHLRHWFAHIDSTGRGRISWREFVHHVMLENSDEAMGNMEKDYVPVIEQHNMHAASKHDQVTRILCSDNGSIISTHEEGDVKIWNNRDYTLEHTIPQSGGLSISDARFMRDGSLLMVASFDRVVCHTSRICHPRCPQLLLHLVLANPFMVSKEGCLSVFNGYSSHHPPPVCNGTTIVVGFGYKRYTWHRWRLASRDKMSKH